MQQHGSLSREIRQCNVCAEYLPMGARPVFQFSHSSRMFIAGQAPGKKVHESAIPFQDASGKRLRAWLIRTAIILYFFY